MSDCSDMGHKGLISRRESLIALGAASNIFTLPSAAGAPARESRNAALAAELPITDPAFNVKTLGRLQADLSGKTVYFYKQGRAFGLQPGSGPARGALPASSDSSAIPRRPKGRGEGGRPARPEHERLRRALRAEHQGRVLEPLYLLWRGPPATRPHGARGLLQPAAPTPGVSNVTLCKGEAPEAARILRSWEVVCEERPGGILKHYWRAA